MDTVFINSTRFGRHWLERLAADSWNRMVRDGCPPEGVTDAGRTLQEQIDVFLRYFTLDFAASAKHDQRTWQGRTYWRRVGKPSAATPGSITARHTFGRALDLNNEDAPTKAWVRANGHRYGWIKDLVRGEDWHVEYQPARDVVLVGSVITVHPPVPKIPTVPHLPDLHPVTPVPIPEPEAVTNVVAIIRSIDTKVISYVCENGVVEPAATTEEVFAMAKILRIPPSEPTWIDLDGFEHTRVLQACERIRRRGQG